MDIGQQSFAILVVLLCSVSARSESLLWTTGTPQDVYTEILPIGSRPHDYGYFSGYESAASPQRWVAVPFRLGESSCITNLQAYYSGDSSAPTNVDYIIWNRQGLTAPTTIAASGSLGPFVANPAIWNFHEHSLNLTLPKGDYYLTIYGSGAPNERAGINWMAGAALQFPRLEQNFIWRSSSFSTSGFSQEVFSLSQSIEGPPSGNPFPFGSIFGGFSGGFDNGGFGAPGYCCGLTTGGGYYGGPSFDPGYYPWPSPTFGVPVTPDLLADPKDVYNPAFTLYGHAVPEPPGALYLVLGGMLIAAMWRRRRAAGHGFFVLSRTAIRTPLPGNTSYFTAVVFLLAVHADHARADIYRWQYINPGDPSKGKQQSAVLAPDGSGVSAVPGGFLSSHNLTMAYLIGADRLDAQISCGAGHDHFLDPPP